MAVQSIQKASLFLRGKEKRSSRWRRGDKDEEDNFDDEVEEEFFKFEEGRGGRPKEGSS